MSFLGEIKRRKVFQVAAVYAVVAWLLVQIVATVEEPLGLPGWFDTGVIVLLAVGFPIAVILSWAFELTPEGIKSAAEVPRRDGGPPAGSQALGYIMQALVLLAVGFLVADQYLLDAATNDAGDAVAETTATNVRVLRARIPLGRFDRHVPSGLRTDIALSRDGTRLAYSAFNDGQHDLYLLELSELEPRYLASRSIDTGNAMPFFSPDGEWVGFTYGTSTLGRISVHGGAMQSLTQGNRNDNGAYWAADGSVLYTNAADEAIDRLYPDEGRIERLTSDAADGSNESWPQLLPGGQAVIYTSSPLAYARDGRIDILTLADGQTRTLIPSGYHARYASSGHILFIRSATLWAVPFDLERLEIVGDQVPVVEGIETDGGRGGAVYAVSEDGLLIYLPGDDTRLAVPNYELVWIDREGRERPIDLPPGNYQHPRIAPDGERFAVTRNTADDVNQYRDIWTYEPDVGTLVRRTFTGDALRPVWTPDGRNLVFDVLSLNSGLGRQRGIWSVAADGSGNPELVLNGLDARASSFSPDGNYLLYDQGVQDIHMVSMAGGQTGAPLWVSSSNKTGASISPDGRWIAYNSDATGREEVYVRPFPDAGAGGPWQISVAGGAEPLWGPEGREIYYRDPTSVLMAVPVQTDPSFVAGRPEALLELPLWDYVGVRRPSYDVTPDGLRFLAVKNEEGRAADYYTDQETSLVVVENWFEELERLAPKE